MIKRRSERGQGLMEYQVLFPAGILVASLLVPAIGFAGRRMMCEAARMFDPDACAAQYEVIAEEDVVEDDEVCTVHEMTDGGSQCDQSDDCTLLDVPLNQGTFYSPDPDKKIKSFVIKAGTGYYIFTDGYTPDGCYYVEFADDLSSVTWLRDGQGKDCKDISHTESWYITLCAPE